MTRGAPSRWPWGLLLAVLGGVAPAGAAAAPGAARAVGGWAQAVHGVRVVADRIRLGAVLRHAPEPWASLDLGPAPQPLQARWLSAAQIRGLVRQAALPPLPLPLPARLRVVRPGQRLDAVWLTQQIEAALPQALPPGTLAHQVVLTSGTTVGEGAVALEVELPAQPRGGRQTLFAALRSADGVQRRLPFVVTLTSPPRPAGRGVRRGQSVHVLLRTGNVRLEARGAAQADGQPGALVPVLPEGGSRVLQAVVRDGDVVEVLP